MDIFKEIYDLKAAGKPFALATIVRTAGSSPRDVGARMLVFPDGGISGTIGGGNFEKMVIKDCLGMFERRQSHLLKRYKFSEDGPDSTGMSCGGEAEVFMELRGKPDRLFIFGGGHVGEALSRIAEEMDFKITVIDDRLDILERYPKSMETILTDADYKDSFPAFDECSYVAIVTNSHKNDLSVLERALRQRCAYIGMIGSKTKVAKIRAALKDRGLDQDQLNSVHAPIGIEIGAEGPNEIAVSIMAELVAVRRKALT